jgi:hypothetical protein
MDDSYNRNPWGRGGTEGECSSDVRKALLPAFTVMCRKIQRLLISASIKKKKKKKRTGKLKTHLAHMQLCHICFFL